MVIEILLLLTPGVISTVLYRVLKKEKFQIYSYVEYYATYTFLVYFLSSAVMYFRGWTDYVIADIGLKAQMKYGIFCLLFAVMLPFAIYYGRKIYNSADEKWKLWKTKEKGSM